ncbi:phosphatidate cytidylyltransferase [Roseitalea porphyridii]|uniref:Phosphatidate cytidylyltransferase n=1 Tax=Roseitalea porphyridii TaxID=1852022 RepID=A0A4P6V050_9HYPH|nr:phosphatidate cytidylyltransferase [Roseitalea porphyridii]QBK30671.1 phosphatidate cytidylyltransferase [Roseitalea porphyridii]
MSNLATRVWSGVVLGTIFLLATLAGGTPFVILVTLMAAVFWAEWIGMKMPGADDRLQGTGILALIACALIVLFAPASVQGLLLVLVLALFAIAAIGLKDRRAIGGFLYAALLLTSLGLLRGHWGFQPGLVAIIFLVAVVWATDIGGYFVGRAVGGPKLAPRVSPNKTIAGALGGLAGAIVAALIVHAAFGVSGWGAAAALAVFLSVLSQAGDLFESWIKRRAGVKDSGRVIPGHGGVMDRVDGLVFAAIGLWFACVLSAGMTEPARAFF